MTVSGGRRPAKHRRRAALVASALVLGLATSGCGRLDRDAVGTYVGTLESSAAEGSLLAHEAAHGRAFRGFVELHAAELHATVEDVEQKLNATPTEAGLSEAAKKAASLAGRVRSQLERLHERPDDRAGAARIQRRLRQASSRLGRIEDSL